MTTTIHLKASRLRDLLVPVVPFADRGPSLSIFASVRLRGQGDYLSALTTDRYRAAVQRIKVAGPEFQAALPVIAARSMLATFKPGRTHDPDLTLTFDADRVHVETDAIADGLFDARIGYRLEMGKWPHIDWLFTDAADAEPVALDRYHVSPHFLADFAKAAPTGEPMRLHVGKRKDGKALEGMLFVSIGDDFRGVLMPVRNTSDDKQRALLDDSWRALLPDVKARDKKAVA